MRIEVTNVCVASCLFCSFAKLEEGAPGAHTMTLEEAWRELEIAHGRPAERDPHRQRAAPGAAVLVLRGAPRGLQAHQARHSPEVLHGGGDPLLRAALRDDASRGPRAPARGGARQPARRRRGDLPPRGALAHLARQGDGRRVPRGAPRRARLGHAHERDDALRAHRDVRAPRRPPAPPARAAGRDRRAAGVHPARVSPRRQRDEEPARADRDRRPAHRRRVAPPARQRAAHQGVLGQHDAGGRADRAPLRRGRHRRDDRARDDLPRRRHRARRAALDVRAARAPHPGGRPHPGRARHALQRRPRAPAARRCPRRRSRCATARRRKHLEVVS